MKKSKWTSRKFWMSVSAQVASLVVLFWPGHDAVITGAAQSVTALITLVLSSLGYVAAESSLDHKAMTPGKGN